MSDKCKKNNQVCNWSCNELLTYTVDASSTLYGRTGKIVTLLKFHKSSVIL